MFALMSDDFQMVVRLVEQLDNMPPLNRLSDEQREAAKLYRFDGDDVQPQWFERVASSTFLIDHVTKSVKRINTIERVPNEQIVSQQSTNTRNKRDHLINDGGCLVAGKWFHSDTHSKVQQLSLVIAGASLPAGIEWKTMDGTFVTMTPTLASQIYAAQMTQEQTIFAHAELLESQLQASLSPETVDITAGWPAVYMGE